MANTYGLNFIQIGGTWIFNGAETPWGGGGVTFDRWWPFLNSAELFQSKVMHEDLVWIGWNQRYANFEGGRSPLLGRLHVTICPEGDVQLLKASENLGICLIQWLVHMVKISSKSELFDFSGGQKPSIRGLTIIKRSCNYGNLPYLVANIYGLNFINIGCIWIFRGQKPPIRGSYIWPVIAIFNLEWAIPAKSHVWKFGLDWLKLEVC